MPAWPPVLSMKLAPFSTRLSAMGSTSQERCYHPELHRLRAEVWRAQGDPAQAEAAFARAIQMADVLLSG